MTNPLDCAVLTVSDTRTLDQDTSGQYLHDALLEMGHQVVAREILPDEVYQIRAQVCQWIAQSSPHVILITGGTGFSGRDGTVQAVRPILDEETGIWRAIPSAQLRRYWQLNRSIPSHGRVIEQYSGDCCQARLGPADWPSKRFCASN